MGVDNRPGSFYNSNAPSWANTGNTQVDDEEEQGGGGVTGVTAPVQDPWSPTRDLPNSPLFNPSTGKLQSPVPYDATKASDEPLPTPEPTPTEPMGGSGTPWYLYKGYGEPTSVQYGFSNTTGYAPGYAPLYNKPTDWRLQGSGVDVARKNDNSPMPQPTKWNAPVTPPPSVTSIPNLPITPQEVAAITPQVKSYSKENPLGLGAGPDTQINAATNIADNQAKLIAGLQELYRVPSQPKGVDTKIIKSPLLPKKLNAFGGGGRGGGGGYGGNWKAALDTMNWNI